MMEAKRHSELIILGSGPAGYTAALYAARANLKPLLLTGLQQGGQLMTTTLVDNWPADVDGVMGPDLMMRFQAHAERFGTEISFDHIHSVDLTSLPFLLEGDLGITYSCNALIIATGAAAKYLGLAGEEKFKGRGVSACATCDGYFFKGKKVAVVGGGNTAVEEALYLSNLAEKVYLVHRRDTFRAEKVKVDQLMEHVNLGKIELRLNQVVEAILGSDSLGVSGVQLGCQLTKQSKELAVDGVFIAIGHTPNTALFKGQIHMDTNGYLCTRHFGEDMVTQTNIKGVFAAGDVQDPIYRQAITSAASGCQAALDAERYLNSLSKDSNQ